MDVGIAKIAEDEDFSALKSLLDAEVGWRLEYSKGTTKVWTESDAGSSVLKMVRVVAELEDVRPNALYDVLHDPAYRGEWDAHMVAQEEVGHLNVNNDIGYYAMSCPPPLKNRDFVLQRSWLDTGDEKMIINHSVHHKDYPPRKGFVRASSILTGYVVRPLQSDSAISEGSWLGYLSRSDPRGQLPTWLVNRVTNIFAPKLVKKLHKAAVEYPAWKSLQPDPDFKPWNYPEQVSTERISLEDCVEVEPAKTSGGGGGGVPDKVEHKSDSVLKIKRKLSKSLKREKESD